MIECFLEQILQKNNINVYYFVKLLVKSNQVVIKINRNCIYRLELT